ncbi:MAG: tRNA1(Val) ((37)-N6)-methyltransferase [Pedobacter sp.]|jgi:tRNA1Val (adenine37-N6)-methyltransferase|nr:tRNA1(Val) ((37)-N6)-methyltransferase [Pedobacter sp.]
MGSIFKFKQFEVDQSDCPMKINTDGVLVGVLATHFSPKYILDIGTGTGVIALMLAQRYENARVEAVEIDSSAANRAELNFKSSPFAERLFIHCADISKYNSSHRYDLILSNPPYFVNDLKSSEPRKGVARHAHEAFFDSLIKKVADLLSPDGVFWLILPVKQAEQMIVNAVLVRLFPSRIVHVFSDDTKAEFRQIVCFSFASKPVVQENFYIYASTGIYTDAYVSLLKDFFLAY